jgi:tripartite-type tricarboxylate transporter receptor subunit TctC
MVPSPMAISTIAIQGFRPGTGEHSVPLAFGQVRRRMWIHLLSIVQVAIKTGGTNMKRLAVLALLASAFSSLMAPSAVAQRDYPNRAITMVVPFAAGGATDVIARIVAEGMSRHLGKPIIIENVAGAGGTIGSIRVMRAAPDGYTLLTGHMGTHASSFALYEKRKYDPRTDFEPIGLAASAPIVVFGRKDLPATTFQEFVALMKEKGPDLKVGHSGIGSNAHLTCKLLNALVGTKPTEIPYRGNGPLMNDLLAGAIDYSCDQVITVAPQVSAGAIKAFAVASPQRSKVLPDIATSEEGGLKAFQADAWTAFFAPKGLPGDIMAKIHAAYAETMADRETIRKLEQLGAVAPLTAQQSQSYLRDLVAADVDRWAKVITDANITIAE